MTIKPPEVSRMTRVAKCFETARMGQSAEPYSKEDKVGIEITGIGGLILLALNVWAFVSIIGSGSTTGSKVLWCLLVLILPLLGFIIWLIAGPRAKKSAV